MASTKKIINLDTITAVIFDMDGTMIANMKHHDLAWEEFLRRYSIELSEEEKKTKISSRRNHEIFGTLFGEDTPSEVREAYAEEKEQLYRDLYKNDIKEVTGLSSILEKLKKRGLNLAIATTAPRKNRDFGLKALGLTETFKVIVGNEDVTRGKPDPQIFLEAAKLLKVEPNQCLVFEDSPVGIEAARNAGMRVVGIATSHTENELNKAETIIKDFSQIILK